MLGPKSESFSLQEVPSLRGGAGGSNRTRKKQDDRLLEGLQKLLQNVDGDHKQPKSKPVSQQSKLLSALKDLVQKAEKEPVDLLKSLQQLVDGGREVRARSEPQWKKPRQVNVQKAEPGGNKPHAKDSWQDRSFLKRRLESKWMTGSLPAGGPAKWIGIKRTY